MGSGHYCRKNSLYFNHYSLKAIISSEAFTEHVRLCWILVILNIFCSNVHLSDSESFVSLYFDSVGLFLLSFWQYRLFYDEFSDSVGYSLFHSFTSPYFSTRGRMILFGTLCTLNSIHGVGNIGTQNWLILVSILETLRNNFKNEQYKVTVSQDIKTLWIYQSWSHSFYNLFHLQTSTLYIDFKY